MNKSYGRALLITAILTALLIYITPLSFAFRAPIATPITLTILIGFVLFLVHNQVKSMYEFSEYFDKRKKVETSTFLFPLGISLLVAFVVFWGVSNRMDHAFLDEGIVTTGSVMDGEHSQIRTLKGKKIDNYQAKVMYYDTITKQRYILDSPIDYTTYHSIYKGKKVDLMYLKSQPTIYRILN